MRSIQTVGISAAPIVETLEGRTHLSVNTWLSSSVSSLSDYTYTAVVQVGDDLSSIPPLWVGRTDGTSVSAGTAGWAWNDDGSFDTGAKAVTVTANPSSTDGISLWVGGTESASIATGSGTFSTVAVQAGVLGDGKMATWSNVVVDFYRGGSVAEEYTVNSLVASTFDATDGGNKEAVAVITATGGACTKVVVSGSLRLQAQPGIYPGGNEVFGKVAIS